MLKKLQRVIEKLEVATQVIELGPDPEPTPSGGELLQHETTIKVQMPYRKVTNEDGIECIDITPQRQVTVQ